MASIEGINKQTSVDNPLADSARGSNKLGKDEFLKLLMAQLGHQDPTNPADSEAFVAQLAQFATLELQQNANSSLEGLLMAQASANQTAITGFVGKDIVYRTDSLSMTAGTPAIASARLAAPAENVTAVVTDANGRTVRTLQLGRQQAGTLAIEWDGRDNHGTQLPSGDYKLRVTAEDGAGKSVAVEQRGSGRVTGVSFEDGTPLIKVGGSTVKVPNIVEINERTTP
jgi:flagellar basal-body rod modification protein FlgD